MLHVQSCTRVRMISDGGHHASARTVYVVQVVPTADRTERLRVLLTVSSNRHCLTHLYPIQPSLMSPGFPNKETPPQIVAIVSDQRNTVCSVTILSET